MSPEARNILNYALLAVGAFAVGCAAALVPQLMDPSMPELNFRIVLGSGLSALLAAYGGSFLPRGGSTRLAEQVDTLKQMGVRKRDMRVVPWDDAPEAEREARLAARFPDGPLRQEPKS